ncbi:MAG: sensor histidine kinase [Flavobacteriales bacterium]
MQNTKKQMYWGFQIIGWGAFTAGNLVFNYLSNGKITAGDTYYSLLIILLGVVCSHFLRFIINLYNWRKERIIKIFHKLAILSIFVGTSHISLLYLISSICSDELIKKFTKADFITQAATFGTIYFLWGIIYFTVYFFRNFKKEEIKNLTQQSKLKEIQLNKFKSQLNPHFIFNSMNGIRSLIEEDAQKAKEGITQLSNILRYTLTLEKKKLISLEEELKLVEDYLNLEKIRLEERLIYEINTSSSCLHYQVPPMLIQTLVENAIKHGISRLIKGGKLIINSKSDRAFLIMEIINSGQYEPNGLKNEQASGFGIENSIQRLQFLFGDQSTFEIRNLNKNEVITILKIPKK